MPSEYYVYIITNRSGTLYIGVTSNLPGRIEQHRQKDVPGFTAQYGLDRLIYFETFENVLEAIEREKQLKRWSRTKKVWLINSVNPEWNDLAHDLPPL